MASLNFKTWVEKHNGQKMDGETCSNCHRDVYVTRIAELSVDGLIRCSGCGDKQAQCPCPPVMETA